MHTRHRFWGVQGGVLQGLWELSVALAGKCHLASAKQGTNRARGRLRPQEIRIHESTRRHDGRANRPRTLDPPDGAHPVAPGRCGMRLPVHWSGVYGKVADVFNDLVEHNVTMAEELARLRQVVGKEGKLKQRAVLNEKRGFWGGRGRAERRMADELARLRQVVGKEGKLKQRASLRDARGFWGESVESINALIDDLVHPTSEMARVIGAVAQGDLSQEHGARGRRPAARGRVPAHRQDDQQDGRAARLLRVRGDARGARGRHRRQARRPGQGEGRRRHLEGPDRLRQLDGRQPDRPGAQHRRRDDRGRQGRPVEEDRRRRQGRVPDAEEHHQHDGRPAALVRLGSDARGARGRHRRQARRPGARRRRVRHLEGPDRLRQLDGRQPDRPGAQHRRRDDGGRQRRPVEEDHRRRARARSSS